MTIELELAKHLENVCPGRFLIPIRVVAKVIDMKYSTCRNKIALGSFPLPTILQGARRFVTAPDLIEYVKKLCGETYKLGVEEKIATAVATEEKRGRGRPKKYPSAARQAAAVRARQARQARKGKEVSHG